LAETVILALFVFLSQVSLNSSRVEPPQIRPFFCTSQLFLKQSNSEIFELETLALALNSKPYLLKMHFRQHNKPLYIYSAVNTDVKDSMCLHTQAKKHNENMFFGQFSRDIIAPFNLFFRNSRPFMKIPCAHIAYRERD
jgi:hypothetical protein